MRGVTYGQKDVHLEENVPLVKQSNRSRVIPNIGSWPDLMYQTCVSCSEIGFKSNEKSVAPIISVPLSHPWTYLATLVIIVLNRGHSWLRLMLTFTCIPGTCIVPSVAMKANKRMFLWIQKDSSVYALPTLRYHALGLDKLKPDKTLAWRGEGGMQSYH